MLERIATAFIVLLLIGAAGAWVWQERYAKGFAAGQLELQSNYDREYTRVANALRADHDRQLEALRKSREADVKRTTARLAAGAAAADELQRLRNEIASDDRRAAAEGPADRPGALEAAAYRRVFAACSEEYLRVAKAAADLKDQLIGLTEAVRIRGDSPAGERSCVGAVDLPTQPATAPNP